jgi:hypothetical protein
LTDTRGLYGVSFEAFYSNNRNLFKLIANMDD